MLWALGIQGLAVRCVWCLLSPRGLMFMLVDSGMERFPG